MAFARSAVMASDSAITVGAPSREPTAKTCRTGPGADQVMVFPPL